MTLRRQVLFILALWLGSVLALAAIAVVGVTAARGDFTAAADMHARQSLVMRVTYHLAGLRQVLALAAPEPQVAEQVRMAQQPGWSADELRGVTALQGRVEQLRREARPDTIEGRSAAQGIVNACLGTTRDLSSTMGQQARDLGLRASTRYARVRSALLWVAGLVVLGAGVALAWVYRRLRRPVVELRHRLSEVAAGRTVARDLPGSPAELSAIAAELCALSEDLARYRQKMEEEVLAKSQALVRSERLAGLGYLSAGIAHEINNPLAVVQGYAEAMLAKAAGSPDAPKLAAMVQECQACAKTVRRVLELSRADGPRRLADLSDLAAGAAQLVSAVPRLRGRKITLGLQPDLGVVVDSGAIRQVLVNLLVNACEATPDGGVVQLASRREAQAAVVTVTDSGRGLSPDELAHLFEPFFTTKRGVQAPGTGLGLAISLNTVREHGGAIEVHSDGPGKGARFTLRLPLATGGAA